eukprot:gnl/Dysnectes_brevis/4107_a5398_484.p1 GENE.gnl/Dysnectes_brevis/4107_a5398_484~~gnl/Dysnectes_brevis/4107_a5398_484.p1  ORF type:complete len:526 (+),score=170.97 gnl/Dysnectes_brevis/4107_a5398_484:102-1679(+)
MSSEETLKPLSSVQSAKDAVEEVEEASPADLAEVEQSTSDDQTMEPVSPQIIPETTHIVPTPSDHVDDEASSGHSMIVTFPRVESLANIPQKGESFFLPDSSIGITTPSEHVRVSPQELAAALQTALTHSQSSEFGHWFSTAAPSPFRVHAIQRELERQLIESARRKITLELGEAALHEGAPSGSPSLHLIDLVSFVGEAAQAAVQDSFWECFDESEPVRWNWNLYLFPLWLVGCAIRYLVLLPLRAAILAFCVVGMGLFTLLLDVVGPPGANRALQYRLIRRMCQGCVMAMGGVIRFHGQLPVKSAGQVFVSNHSSMIDWIVLSSLTPFSVVGQLHKSWIKMIQTRVLGSLDPLWFNRGEAADRRAVAQGIRDHVFDSQKRPLLLFPEGTCVNNRFCVMFKKGAFQLGAEVVPIAIKYNETFSSTAYWNSRRHSFLVHLGRIMSSWALVADVWFLDPEVIRQNETAAQFAERVKLKIAAQAGLRPRNWNGFLKYCVISERMLQARRVEFLARMGVRDALCLTGV